MVQLSSGGLSPVNTQFQQVRAIDKTGRGNVLGKAISDVITGVSVFGKASAREAGAAVATEQQGLSLPQEQISREVDDVNEAIAQGLASEKDSVEGPVDSRRVNDLKDASLREATLTDRHIQGLIDSGTISSTEGNARRRIQLAKLKNRGSNFLFTEEFDNAFFSITGGTRGSAQSAIFPKTAAELKQEAIDQEKIKVEAEFEGQKQNIKLLMPHLSEPQIQSELSTQFINQRRTQELELRKAEQGLTQDQAAEMLDLTQSNITRSLEVQLFEFTQPNGTIDQGATNVLQTKVQQARQAMLEQLATTPGLSAPARKSAEGDIATWVKGQEARFKVASAARFNKEALDNLNVVSDIAGVAAAPFVAIMDEVAPNLVTELAKQPINARPNWLKVRVGEENATNLTNWAATIRDMANFSLGKVSLVKNPESVASMFSTKTGRTDAGKEENRKKWINIYSQASEVAFNSLTKTFGTGVKPPQDVNEKTAVLDLYNVHQANLANNVRLLGTKFPTIRVTTSDLTGLERVVLDIPEDLQGITGVQESLVESFISFKRNPWLWSEKGFENPEDAFNEYVSGGFSLAPENFDTEVGKRGTIVRTPKVEEPTPAAATEGSPLSVQNNNPANLRSFGSVPTVDTASGTFVRFPNKADGVRAAARNFTTKIRRGDNTIDEIISQQSPDADPENIKRGFTNEPFKVFVEKELGKERSEELTEEDLPKLLEAIFAFESGNQSDITDAEILQGIEDAQIDR